MGRTKQKQVKATSTSGVLFIGDAEYFVQSQHPDVTVKIPNPLESIDYVADKVHAQDLAPVEFPNGMEGRGILVQTHLNEFSYTIKKKINKKTGKITITIVLA